MEFYQYIGLFCGFWATLLNICLIPIILMYSSEKIGTYKYCLLLYTSTAAVMSCCQLNTLLVWYIPKNGFLLYSTLNVYPFWLQKIFMCGFPAAFCANLMALCWSFMTREELFQRPLKKKVVLSVLLAIILWILSQIVMFPIHGTREVMLLFREEIFNVSNVNLDEVAFFGTPLSGYGFPWEISLAVGYYTFYMTIAGFCVVSCWWKIRRRLGALRQLQISSFKIQHRLYVLLTLQATLPLIFNMSPAGLAFFVGLTQLEGLGNVIICCGSIISCAQILDPIFTVVLIKDYQRAILKVFRLRTRIHEANSQTDMQSRT